MCKPDSPLAIRYQNEWLAELREKGVEVNAGTPALLHHAAVKGGNKLRRTHGSLNASAKAFAKARAAGRVRFVGEK